MSKAAHHELAIAQYALAEMYENGEGGLVDPGLAK